MNPGQSPATSSEKCSSIIVDDVPLNGPALSVLSSDSFIQQSMEIILEDAVKKATDVREKVRKCFLPWCSEVSVNWLYSCWQVCEWRRPEELKKLLDLELRDQGESETKILERCQETIRYSVKTSKSSLNELTPHNKNTSWVSCSKMLNQPICFTGQGLLTIPLHHLLIRCLTLAENHTLTCTLYFNGRD